MTKISWSFRQRKWTLLPPVAATVLIKGTGGA
jgi:hypothetical protein